jgi:enamine deaminase RidA (YjgF/YER057c/UK114 family)
MRHVRISTGSPWEKAHGYPRLVRAGSVVAVSGTVAADSEGRALGTTAYEQTAAILRVLGEALVRAGASLADVVRLRVLYADPDVAPGFFRAMTEAFPEGYPALTTVRVVSLVAPEFLVEIEADAVSSGPPERPDGAPPPWDEGVD